MTPCGKFTFLYHHVKVEDSDKEHRVPEHHQEGHEAEQEPHIRSSLWKLIPEKV